MVWYLGQSLLILGASFLFGLLVGWAVWRLPWRRRHFGESDVISALNRQHTLELAAWDERVARLQDHLDGQDHLAGRVPTDSSPDPGQLDQRDLAAQPRDGTAAPSFDPAADFPDAWMTTDGLLIEDAEYAQDAEPLADEAHYEAPGPRPPAHFPAAANAELTSSDPATAELDLRAAATASGQEAPSQQEAPSKAAIPDLSHLVADLRGDDLTRIVGISAEIADSLAAAGLRTYQDLAGARPHEVESALGTAATAWPDTRRTWPRQAQLLTDGDTTGFDRLAWELTTDRETSSGL